MPFAESLESCLDSALEWPTKVGTTARQDKRRKERAQLQSGEKGPVSSHPITWVKSCK